MQAFKAAKCLMPKMRRLPLAVGGIAVNSVDDLDVDDLGPESEKHKLQCLFRGSSAQCICGQQIFQVAADILEGLIFSPEALLNLSDSV